MTRLAIAGNPGFILDTTDIDRPAPHTTFSLLPLLQQAYPSSQLWLLVGSDSIRDFPTWRRPEQIITQCRLATLPRPGIGLDWPYLESAVPGLRTVTELLDGPTLDLSSTDIRQRARERRSLRYLVPDQVLDYIKEMGLYR